MTTNILAPFIKVEESFQFYVNGRTFEMKEDTLNVVEKIDSTLKTAIAAFESFEFKSDSIKWFHGPSKFVFDINENKFKHNDSLIEGNTFTTHVLTSGMVRYNNKPTAELFESLPTMLENFIVLDFAATFEGNNNVVDVFKLDEKVYVSRFNTENRLSNFFIAESANAAVEYVTEKTGESAASFLSELVEGEAKELAQLEANITECRDMIAFLKDQRGILAEADKTISEIKAADQLINEEIKKWEDLIKVYEAKEIPVELAQAAFDVLADNEANEVTQQVYFSQFERGDIKRKYKGKIPRGFASNNTATMIGSILSPLMGDSVYMDGNSLLKGSKTIMKIEPGKTKWADIKKKFKL